MYTAHRDVNHCFSETKDGTLKVNVRGDWLPRTIFRRCYALCSVLRMVYLAFYMSLFAGRFDVIFCDQVSACIPVFRLFTRAKVVFYCHFPDKCLCTERRSALKRCYRWFLDGFEGFTTGLAHTTLVNSQFTARTFRKEFPRIKTEPRVVYPCINTDEYHTSPIESFRGREKELGPAAPCTSFRHVVVSINRFERKKNLALAVDMLARLRDRDPALFRDTALVLAGGYDPQNRENVEHLQELKDAAQAAGIAEHVLFVPSFSTAQRSFLFAAARCLVYTPSNEHFGIVPVEAMYSGVPVIACASGGPLESVEDGVTGYLCAPDPGAFADAAHRLLSLDEEARRAMTEAGKQRVLDLFSLATFTDDIERALR
eukprot:gnl/Trimastix_PCT/3106.p1 GENE.gnl/Trimastix_PCT/3106~~gnl/Trimastix_PCT/3106.p1  ORF type:complete len:431 (+),score=101.49 gnl/Trimastix_PCT/3106:183-1295(+)